MQRRNSSIAGDGGADARIFFLLQHLVRLSINLKRCVSIKLILLHEQRADHLVSGVFDEQLVLVAAEDDADRRVVAIAVFLAGEVAQIQVHLTDVVGLHVVDLQINEDEAAQDALVKDQINLVVRVVQRNAVLPPDEGETLAEFEQELLEVVAKNRFELGFRYLIRLGDFQELEDVRLAQQVGGLFDDLALRGELQDAGLVFAGGKSQEQ